MNIFTPDDSNAMIDAVFGIYKNACVNLEQRVYQISDQCIDGYTGGTWHFHTDEKIGFWVPDTDTVAVSCAGNYYTNPAMAARDYGVAATLMALNQQVWSLYERSGEDAARDTQKLYQALYNHAYQDGSPYNTGDIYNFLD
jgi:hypothetical protein